jgi:hypothetical protein
VDVRPLTFTTLSHDATALAASARIMPLLLSLALLAGGWAVIGFARTTMTIEGRITQVRAAPGLMGPGFAVTLTRDDGRHTILRLDGPCADAKHRYGACRAEDFPLGARLRVEMSDFFVRARCRPGDRVADQPNCLPSMRSRWKSMQRIESLAVDGQAVTSGWSFRSLALLPYLWIGALALVLAWHGWRLAAIPVTTLLALAAVFWPLFVPVMVGVWNQFHAPGVP